jgi:putative methyltransferase (TIGR04325 family)
MFASFAEAAQSAPTASLGYDSPEAASMYRDRLERPFAADYPVLYWLHRWLPAVRHVLDLGGHVGVSYYAFRPYLAEAAAMRWTVSDVPAVMAAGRALAEERGASELQFADELSATDPAELFLAAGSLQYLETPLSTILRSLRALPRYVLVNKLPTHATRGFVTLQHIGVSYCPYRITAAGAVAADLGALGYREVDNWTNPELTCIVPFEPTAAPITYRGCAFERV